MTGNHHALDAGDGCREQGFRQPHLLHDQRRPRAKVMRFGATTTRCWGASAGCATDFGPLLGAALRAAGGLELAPLIARGPRHGRRDAPAERCLLGADAARASAALLRATRPARETLGAEPGLHRWQRGSYFLNIGMAMGKAVMDPARDIEACSLVAAMFRNGTDFGIRLSGTGDEWFHPRRWNYRKGLYFPGYSEADANPDMGDSAIMETVGLGAFAMAAAPAGDGLRRRRPRERRARLHAGDGRHHAGEESEVDHSRAGRPGRAGRHRSCARSPPPACSRRSTPASRTASPAVGQVGAGVARRAAGLLRQGLGGFLQSPLVFVHENPEQHQEGLFTRIPSR